MSSNTGVKKGSGFRSGRSRSSTDLLLLHLNILIFSFTGVFSKFAAESIRTNGLFSIRTILWGILIIANCGIYAIFLLSQCGLQYLESALGVADLLGADPSG